MPRQLFPPEIIENTTEYYHTRISTRSRVIYTLLLLLLVCTVVALPLVKVDVTSQSRGEIRSVGENIAIQSALYGEVTRYAMSENQAVLQGDTLLALNTDKLVEQVKLLQTQIADNTLFMGELSFLLKGQYGRLSHPKYRGAYNQYRVKVNELQINVDFLKKELDTQQKLFDKKVIASYDYQLAKNNYDKAFEQLRSLKNEYGATWLNEQTELSLRNQELQSNIVQLEKDGRQYVIVAPATGVLVQVAGVTNHNFIAPGQTLGYISQGDSLLAECYISPADIGYIRQGQDVSFQFDAFNYNDWGMISGHVSEILHDVVLVQDNPVFRVRCALDKQVLVLKSGYEGRVQKGLTFTSRFTLARRSLWQLLFDKVDNWLNPKLMTACV